MSACRARLDLTIVMIRVPHAGFSDLFSSWKSTEPSHFHLSFVIEECRIIKTILYNCSNSYHSILCLTKTISFSYRTSDFGDWVRGT